MIAVAWERLAAERVAAAAAAAAVVADHEVAGAAEEFVAGDYIL